MQNKKSYAEKLKDPRWQKKRLEILERDEWKCMSCGDKENTLHVHHIFYFPGKEPWDVHNGFLITLCEKCHKVGPCEKGLKSCSGCSEYIDNNGDCEGPNNAPEDLQSCIGSLLNEVWKSDHIGDFFANIGYIAMGIN